MTRTIVLTVAVICFGTQLLAAEQSQGEWDLVVYGGTSAGVIAAVQAKKMGKSIVVVSPDKHLGGLSSGGLGWTDSGNKAVIGGLSRDFYHRIWKAYQRPENWKWQKQSEYGNKGQGIPAIDGEDRTMWIFEPSIAELVFESYVREFSIPVHRNEWLDRHRGVQKTNGRIKSIKMLSGKTFAGKMFIDATYEGDLMATVGVDYHVGREGKNVYDEGWNGVQTEVLHHQHHFGVLNKPVSPYQVSGDPASGVLPRVSVVPPGEKYAGDHRIQAYCFRMCLTNHPENRIPFEKPPGYDPKTYELLLRIYDAGFDQTFGKFDPIPNCKTDTNNHGPMSTDNIGFNYEYPDGNYERRREIIQEHENYQKGWLYFIANDPHVPAKTRQEMQRWGLPKDEFVDNGHWSHQLYIREARRMVGKFVMTEHELLKRRETPQSVGMGSYTMDSHNVQRYITPEGYVQNEGDIGVGTQGPYKIAYGSLVPKRDQCQNLFVPVCVSSSHIAFGSIRMEPVFMILGQSAATAAVMAIDDDLAVQDVPYQKLCERLEADGQVLAYVGPVRRGPGAGISLDKLKGIVVDDQQAKKTGHWKSSTSSKQFVGFGYRHDDNRADGNATARFEAKLPASGRYEVRIACPPNSNRATAVPVTIHHAEGSTTIHLDQRKAPEIDDLFHVLGEFSFDASTPAVVSIDNSNADGYVILDAVQWLPAK